MIDKKGMLQKMMLADEKPSMGSDAKSLEAKLAAMQQIIDALRSEVVGKAKGDLSGLQKVSVMAPDEQGLKKGLDLAAQMAADKGGSMVDPEGASDEADEENSESAMEKLAELKDPSLEGKEEMAEEAKPEDEEPVSHDTFGGGRSKKSPKYY